MKAEKITAVVPCYNEEDSLPYFYEAMIKTLQLMKQKYELQFELIFVNDGSKDKTLEIIKSFVDRDFKVKYISFSRNFGKEAAIYAGLKASTGDYVAVLDADMQDPPSLLLEMYEIIKLEGYDSVATRRISREGEPPVRSFFARIFYKIINMISNADIVDGARDFRLMKRIMVDAIISMGEYNRFSKGIFGWVGFKTKWIPYINSKRIAGETKWSFWKLFMYSLEGIIAFSTMPLLIASVAGILLCLIAFLLIVIVIMRTLIWGDSVQGWPSLVCIITFIGGLQLFCLGIIGQYLAKTYLECKKRPIYVIAEEN
ncbi:glycosyltransferase family 2 protein [Aminipila sp.]|uniref:glycosyltransferase family 2 protein n=1 Tax=Aminipila sp. TaxID=2060095 RepID=UPI0028A264B3|nr:glycosyltransferase family 2 protein [Aminipila sp.]